MTDKLDIKPTSDPNVFTLDVPSLKLFYREHDCPVSRVRVWRNDWPGDTFEIMSLSDFQVFAKQLTKFAPGILIQADDSFEDINID